MHDQDALAIGGDVLGLSAQPDTAHLELEAEPGAEHLVVVAGDVGDLRTPAGVALFDRSLRRRIRHEDSVERLAVHRV